MPCGEESDAEVEGCARELGSEVEGGTRKRRWRPTATAGLVPYDCLPGFQVKSPARLPLGSGLVHTLVRDALSSYLTKRLLSCDHF